jgi:pantoate--beta-alanine ligase
MFISKRVPHVQEWIAKHKRENTTLGFVPTMGALHEGHISLVQLSKSQCDLTLVSVFVNPLQFNDPEDLKKYPRPVESDIEKIYRAQTDVLFLPDVVDVYPRDENDVLDFDPGPMGEVMEGKFRPGHFKGVAEVVYRLLKIIEPDKLYLGQKDFQQVSIIRKLISDVKLPVDVVVGPTLRESNGLAMSSRNMRLSDQGKEEAAVLFKTLNAGKKSFDQGVTPALITEQAMQTFREKKLEPEYFEIVDGKTLQPYDDAMESNFVVACCAVKVEGIRLIDNVIYKQA